ncbi:MAG: ATP-binding protein [Bryobacteraceae bacterium]
MAKPDCKLCGGTGWIVEEEEGISAAERCTCVAEGRAEELEGRAQIPSNYRNASMDSFQIPHGNPIASEILKRIMAKVKSYTRHFPALPKPGLLLAGAPGVGKTHLAVAALRELIARGHEGIFFDYQNLLERIRSGYSQTLGTSDREAYRIALETEILLLDDLGAHRVTDWVEDTVTAIITYRYNHRKPLIATTNLPDPDMGGEKTDVKTTLEDRVGERARSRLFEMCTIVPMWGVNDYRVKPPGA